MRWVDGRAACPCVSVCARAVSTGAHVREGVASQQLPARVHHLASNTASTVAITVHDTMSALVLGRNAQLAKGADYERLGARPGFLVWLVRLLARLTIAADDLA